MVAVELPFLLQKGGRNQELNSVHISIFAYNGAILILFENYMNSLLQVGWLVAERYITADLSSG